MTRGGCGERGMTARMRIGVDLGGGVSWNDAEDRAIGRSLKGRVAAGEALRCATL